jgi:hypothetical protein
VTHQDQKKGLMQSREAAKRIDKRTSHPVRPSLVPLSGTAYFPLNPEEPRKMTARPHEKDEDPPAAAEPLDPEFV